MRQTLPWGSHRLFDLIARRVLQRFYDRVAVARPDARAILDVGCGPGHLAAALAHHHPDANVLGVDLDPVMVRLARARHDAPNLDFRHGDAAALPLQDEDRDWATATETLHHWSDPGAGLDEVHRVLRPDGEFWLVEAAGDMTRDELAAWVGRRPWPGVAALVRGMARTHGYTPEALHGRVLPLLEARFAEVAVDREDGWWVVACRKDA